MQELLSGIWEGLKHTTWLEAIAVVAGIASVFFSRAESIWVYPIGLINTVIYIYLSVKAQLYGEASVNFYYTVMSVYGWVLWLQKDEHRERILNITFSTGRQWRGQLMFFATCYLVLFSILQWLKNEFSPGAVPWADAFASATAYTGMYLMAKKKVESWYWWMATNIASIPLYYSKGFVFTSFQYLVLLGLAVSGLLEWRRRAKRLIQLKAP